MIKNITKACCGLTESPQLNRLGTAFTLRGLVAELAEQGVKTDSRAARAFVHEQKLSFQKSRAGRRTGAS